MEAFGLDFYSIEMAALISMSESAIVVQVVWLHHWVRTMCPTELAVQLLPDVWEFREKFQRYCLATVEIRGEPYAEKNAYIPRLDSRRAFFSVCGSPWVSSEKQRGEKSVQKNWCQTISTLSSQKLLLRKQIVTAALRKNMSTICENIGVSFFQKFAIAVQFEFD